MEDAFAKLAISTVSFVGKAAFGMASRAAIQQIGEYMRDGQRKKRQVERGDDPESELRRLRGRFETKLRIVTPAIDLVEIIAARGNTALESVLELTTALRRDMDRFARHVAEDLAHDAAAGARTVTASARIVAELRALLARIEDAVPFLNLALTTSGANLGTSLPSSVSPSRLMQASAALADCARRFGDEGRMREEWVWPAFDLRLYRMFRGSVRAKSLKDSTWVTEMVRCTGRVARVPGRDAAVVVANSARRAVRAAASDGGSDFDSDDDDGEEDLEFGGALDYVYDLVLEEDLDDGMYHEELEDRGSCDGGEVRGREWRIAVEEVERLYYSSSGRLLEIEEAKHPVLVLKVVRGAGKLRASMPDRPSTPPPGAARGSGADPMDVEWYALELYHEGDMAGDEDSAGDGLGCDNSDDDEEEDDEEQASAEEEAPAPKTAARKAAGGAAPTEDSECPFVDDPSPLPVREAARPTAAALIGTLSLLEFMVRLSALEVCLQRSHLEAPDEMINLFLRDDQMTAAATGDSDSDSRPASSRGNTPQSAERLRSAEYRDDADSERRTRAPAPSPLRIRRSPRATQRALAADAAETDKRRVKPAAERTVRTRQSTRQQADTLPRPPRQPKFTAD